jgi:hypothetical protein
MSTITKDRVAAAILNAPVISKLSDFVEITNHILYGIEPTNEIEHVKFKSGAFIKLNEKYASKYIEDVTTVSFTNFYTFLMLRNWKIWSKHVNYPEIFSILLYLFDLKGAYDGEYRHKIKCYMNFIYGAMTSGKYDKLQITSNLVSLEGARIMSLIYGAFNFNVIYADTSNLYIYDMKSIENEFKEYMDEFTLPYRADMLLRNGVFIAKKKYFLVAGGLHDIKGFRKFKG